MSFRRLFDPAIPIFRIRVGDTIKTRYAAIAKVRGCDPSDVAREGLLTFAAAEEKRLGIAGDDASKEGAQP